MRGLVIAVALALAALVDRGDALAFDLPHGERKCFGNNIAHNAPATASFEVLNSQAGTPSGISMVVVQPSGEQEHASYDLNEEHYQFSAAEEGVHSVCFENNDRDGRHHRIRFEFEKGTTARHYEEVAMKRHLDPLESELMKIERRTDEVLQEIHFQMTRENQFRDVNEATNSRVMMYSGFSIGVLLIVAIWQVYHLQNYLKSVKLL